MPTAATGGAVQQQQPRQAPYGYEMDPHGNFIPTVTGGGFLLDQAKRANENSQKKFDLDYQLEQQRAMAGNQNASALQGLYSSFLSQQNSAGSGGGGGGSSVGSIAAPQQIQYPSAQNLPPIQMTPNSANIPKVQDIDRSGANAAIFARAKDQVGDASQGALAGLRSQLGGRGMLGSGAESRGTASVVNKGLGQLGEVTRQQAITDTDIGQRTAEANYQGGISQRGQDISAAGTDYQGKIAQRGQDVSAAGTNYQGQIAQAGQNYQGQIQQRGQDIQAAEAAAARQQAQKQSALQSLIQIGGLLRY